MRTRVLVAIVGNALMFRGSAPPRFGHPAGMA
jgi:hypothetical protein